MVFGIEIVDLGLKNIYLGASTRKLRNEIACHIASIMVNMKVLYHPVRSISYRTGTILIYTICQYYRGKVSVWDLIPRWRTMVSITTKKKNYDVMITLFQSLASGL